MKTRGRAAREPGQNRKSKRAEIIKKARRLFWKQGYRETTIKDIADACNCLPGNIYNYFSDKESLLYEVILEEVEVLVASTTAIMEDKSLSPIDQLKAIIKTQVDIMLGPVKTPDILFETEMKHLSPSRQKEIIKLRDAYEKAVQETINRGLKAGLFVKTNVKLASFNIIAMIVRTRLWYSPSGELSFDEIADNIIDFTLNGIGKK